jgi:hypothetical protein
MITSQFLERSHDIPMTWPGIIPMVDDYLAPLKKGG